jgi:hypothetical protein
MEDLKIIQSKPTDPDTEKWHDFLVKEQQETPKRLEDAAKALTGIISITLALFLSVGKSSFENSPGCIIKSALVAWLVSLVVAFVVTFPFAYRFPSGSTGKFREKHKVIVRNKYVLLILSTVLYVAALVLLAWRFFAC